MATENVGRATSVVVGYDQRHGGLTDTVDLDAVEDLGPRRVERLSERPTLCRDMAMKRFPDVRVRDPDEVPGLGQTNTRRRVRGRQDAVEDRLVRRLTGELSAYVSLSLHHLVEARF